jgi:DNA-directed RNA polymerase specialized sigma24 family protein
LRALAGNRKTALIFWALRQRRAWSWSACAAGKARPAAELIAVDEALAVLTKLHWRQSQVLELRFFGGWSVEETAETLKISSQTVMREWCAAKAWVYLESERSDAGEQWNAA